MIEAIAASLDGFDLGEEWEEEIRQRVDDIDSGRVRPVAVKKSPWQQLQTPLEQRYEPADAGAAANIGLAAR